MRWTIEHLEIAKSGPEAVEMIAGLRLQEGYLGGRILPPSPSKPTWRVQVFFDSGDKREGWLPDGSHYRITPVNLLNARGAK